MKKSSLALLVSLFVAASSNSGCAESSEPEETFPAPKDDAFVAASETTTRETGIARWGVTKDTSKLLTVVHGYGAKNEPLVELKHEAKVVDDTHIEIDIALSGARGAASMRIGFAGRPSETNADESIVEATMIENTFVDASADATKVLDRMRADTGEGDTAVMASDQGAMNGGGGSLVQQSLHPNETTGEMVRRCGPLLRQCGGEIVRTGVSTVMNTQACGQLLRTRGVTMLCRWAGGFIGGRLGGAAGAAAGTAVAPGVGTAIGAAVGHEAGGKLGGWLAESGCRWAIGSTRDEEERVTRECIGAASNAVMSATSSSQQCRDLAQSCR